VKLPTTTSTTGQSVQVNVTICQCCIEAGCGDGTKLGMTLVPNRNVECPDCHGLCSCPGCIAEATS